MSDFMRYLPLIPKGTPDRLGILEASIIDIEYHPKPPLFFLEVLNAVLNVATILALVFIAPSGDPGPILQSDNDLYSAQNLTYLESNPIPPLDLANALPLPITSYINHNIDLDHS